MEKLILVLKEILGLEYPKGLVFSRSGGGYIKFIIKTIIKENLYFLEVTASY